MKLLAFLLVTASLVMGTIASTTAYVPTIDAIEASGQTLTLNDPAGRSPEDPEQPLLSPGEDDVLLTPENVQLLKAAKVERVRVKEFSFARWQHKWYFLAAVVGLLVGAFIIKADQKKAVAASLAVEKPPAESPEHALRTAQADVVQLSKDVAAASTEAQKIDLIVHRLENIQRTHLSAFVDARAELIGKLGMSGYARLMDKFASAERKLNRAWSAAADHVLDEAELCLAEGAAGLGEAMERLG